MTDTQQQQYIIDIGMLMQWRVGCINPYELNPDINRCHGCEYRGKGARKDCCDFDDEAMQKIFCSNPIGDAIPLTPSLTQHYAERSQATGKTIPQLVLQDLAALHKKRVAREERRVWKDIEYERL
jgi:hypothetical protein